MKYVHEWATIRWSSIGINGGRHGDRQDFCSRGQGTVVVRLTAQQYLVQMRNGNSKPAADLLLSRTTA